MPKATQDKLETKRIELESCAGGFVVIRRMDFGEVQARRDFLRLVQEEDGQASLRSGNVGVALFDFKTCIVDHNLEDASGRPLNFTDAKDVQSLEQSIGSEIENAIIEFTAEGGEKQGNSIVQSSSPNSGEASPTEKSQTEQM